MLCGSLEHSQTTLLFHFPLRGILLQREQSVLFSLKNLQEHTVNKEKEVQQAS